MKSPTWTDILTAISAFGAWVSSTWALRKVREVHVLVNSRLTQLLHLTERSSFAEGEKSQKDKAEKDAPNDT
jgi:hypothetical protein